MKNILLGLALLTLTAFSADVTPPNVTKPQPPNTILIGPTSGGNALSTFRVPGAADWTAWNLSLNGTNITTGTISAARLSNITNTQIDTAAAIAGTKVNPDFGAQLVTTTGTGNFAGGIVLDPSNASLGVDPIDLIGDGSAFFGNGLVIIDTGGITTFGIPGTPGKIRFANNTSGILSLVAPAGVALGTNLVTLPNATDTLVGKATTDTLTNKTINGTSNTLVVHLSTDVTGILPVTNGGSGLATLTAHAVQVGNGTGTVTQLTVPASGTILQGVASSDPVWTATPTLGVAGTTVGTLSFANATSGTIKFQPTTGALGTTVLTLPATSGTLALTGAAAGGDLTGTYPNPTIAKFQSTTLNMSSGVGANVNTSVLVFNSDDAAWEPQTFHGDTVIDNTAAVTITNVADSALSVNIAKVVGHNRSTFTNVASGVLATFTPVADGTFLISANVLVTTSTVHAFTVTCSYKSEEGTSRTVTLQFSNLAGTFVTSIANAAGTVPYEGVPLHIRAKSGTAITIQSAAGGTYTGVVYNLEGYITQIGN